MNKSAKDEQLERRGWCYQRAQSFFLKVKDEAHLVKISQRWKAACCRLILVLSSLTQQYTSDAQALYYVIYRQNNIQTSTFKHFMTS